LAALWSQSRSAFHDSIAIDIGFLPRRIEGGEIGRIHRSIVVQIGRPVSFALRRPAGATAHEQVVVLQIDVAILTRSAGQKLRQASVQRQQLIIVKTVAQVRVLFEHAGDRERCRLDRHVQVGLLWFVFK
jgi:hypothetical protein